MLLSAEQKYLLWLSAAQITADRVQALRSEYGTLGDVWESFGKTGGPKFHGGAKDVLQALHSRDALDEWHGKLERKNVKFLFETDDA